MHDYADEVLAVRGISEPVGAAEDSRLSFDRRLSGNRALMGLRPVRHQFSVAQLGTRTRLIPPRRAGERWSAARLVEASACLIGQVDSPAISRVLRPWVRKLQPKRVINTSRWAKPMRLALDGPGRDAADEEALQAEEDHERHDHGDESRRGEVLPAAPV